MKTVPEQVKTMPRRQAGWGAVLFVLLVLAGWNSARAQSQYWQEDATFAPVFEGDTGIGGVVLREVYPGGKVLITTSYSIVSGRVIAKWLTRLNGDGTVDATFVPEGDNGRVLMVYPDGRILYSSTNQVSGYNATVVKRMLADGSADPAFTPAQLSSSYVSALLLGDGRIYLAGDFSTVGGVSQFMLTRLNADGTRDMSFTSPFSGTYSLNSVVPTADGQKLIVAGGGLGLGTGRNSIARLNLDGSVDSSFSTGSYTFSRSIVRVYAEADGKVVAVDTVGDLVRFTAAGAQDASFAPVVVGDTDSFGPRGADGKLYYTTNRVVTSGSVVELRRMSQGFTDDTSFTAIATPYASGYQVGLPQVFDDDSLLLGPLTEARKRARLELSRVLGDGSLDPNFNPRFSRPANMDAYLRLSDGRCLVAGQFERVNGTVMPGGRSVVRLLANGSLDPTFSSTSLGAASIERLAVQPDGRILVMGNIPLGGGNYGAVVRLATNGNLDATYATAPTSLFAVVADSAGRIYGVRSGESTLRRFLANGQPDSSFQAPALAGVIYAIRPLADGSTLLLQQTSGADYASTRLLGDGSLDTNFTSRLISTPVAIVELPDSSALVFTRENGGLGGWFLAVRRLRPNGDLESVYTSRVWYNSIVDWDIQLAIAGLVCDLLKEAAGAAPAGLWVDLRDNSLRMSLACTTEGEFMRAEAPSALGSFLRRYLRAGTSSLSFDPGPFVTYLNPLVHDLVPLNSSYSPQVIAGGLAPFSYQWWHAGAAIAGSTQSSLLLSRVQAASSGNYHVVVTNAHGSVTSSVITLTVDTVHASPWILSQPVGRTVVLGEAVTLSVVAEGNPAPTYEWLLNDSPISGATGSSYSIAAIQVAQLGRYRVIVRNTVQNSTGTFSGFVSSQQAILGLGQAITFATLPDQDFSPTPITLSASATSGLTVSFAVVAGPASISGHSLTLNGTGTVTVRASQAGDSSYVAAAPVERSFAVASADQAIVFPGPSNQPFSPEPILLEATASSGLAVTFSVVSGPATIAGTSLTLSGAGPVTVRAMQGGDGNYNGAVAIDRTFTIAANFDSWSLGKFSGSELADMSISGPNADPDGDGYSNLMEYALGLEPKSPSSTGLPEVSTTATDWVYTYTRPADRTELTYTVEVSTDLTSWSTGGVTHELVSSSGVVDTWRARYPLASAGSVFFRIKISQ